MLKLKDISSVENIRNESDFYVQIKIGFDRWYTTHHPLCYWSTGGGPQKSLIEIRLIKPIGTICAFTVVSMPKVHNQEAPNIYKKVIEKIGLPIFEISSWQENRYLMEERASDAKDFEVYATANNVFILFSSNEIVLNIINGPITFGFDQNNFLCLIKISGMKLNKEGFLEEIQKTTNKTNDTLTLGQFTTKKEPCFLTFTKSQLSMINQEVKRLNNRKQINLKKPIFQTMEKLSRNVYGLAGYEKVQINICDFLHNREELLNFANILKEAIDSARQNYTWDSEYYKDALAQYNILLNYFSE